MCVMDRKSSKSSYEQFHSYSLVFLFPCRTVTLYNLPLNGSIRSPITLPRSFTFLSTCYFLKLLKNSIYKTNIYQNSRLRFENYVTY